MSELEKLVVAKFTEFLYCLVLYEWRGDAEDLLTDTLFQVRYVTCANIL